MNKVISGDYNGKSLCCTLGKVNISTGLLSQITVDKTTVQAYEIIEQSSKTNAASAVGRAAAGAFFLGPIGIAAGATAKKDKTYTIAIYFKDGKKSLVEVDEKFKKEIVKALF